MEKGAFCNWMAAAFSPPERETVECLRTEAAFSRITAGEPCSENELAGSPSAADSEPLHVILEREYDRTFGGRAPGPVSLVESSYKPWTLDENCRLSFAREKGLLMGDSAAHMEAIFQELGADLPEGFRACPDHLVLELEFLSALYERASDREVRQFIRDHLDWVPELKTSLLEFQAHPFYLRSCEVLTSFLDEERERLEITENGKKSVH